MNSLTNCTHCQSIVPFDVDFDGDLDLVVTDMTDNQFGIWEQTGGSVTELVAWFRFDDEGNLGLDSSGDGHHGQVLGTTYDGDGLVRLHGPSC